MINSNLFSVSIVFLFKTDGLGKSLTKVYSVICSPAVSSGPGSAPKAGSFFR